MSIRANGGAVRYWTHAEEHDYRCVLCANGHILVKSGSGHWRDSDLKLEDMKQPRWREDTRAVISAAISRTQRDARRGGADV